MKNHHQTLNNLIISNLLILYNYLKLKKIHPFKPSLNQNIILNFLVLLKYIFLLSYFYLLN